MLRVLHLLPRARRRTAGRVLDLARSLAGLGVESRIVLGVPDDGTDGQRPVAVLHERGVVVTEFASPAGLSAGLSAGLRALLDAVPGHDLVHGHDPLLAPQLASVARSLTGVPYLTSAHCVNDRYAGLDDPERLLRANDYGAALVAADAADQDRLAALAPGVPVHLVPDGVDPDAEPGDEVVFTGSAVDAAWLPALLAALATVRPGLRLRVADGTALPGAVLTELSRLGLPGPVPVPEAGTEHGGGPALLLAPGERAPADEWLLTAAAAGVPVITGSTTAADVLGADYPGLMPPGPVTRAAVTELASRMLGPVAPRDALAEARKRVADQYAWSAVAARYRDIYQSLSEGQAPREGEGPRETVRMALPDITGAEIGAASVALRSAKLSAGPHVADFEREFAEWHGVPHAIAVNSAAAALFATLVCAGVRGEVLVPSFTWAATANAVVAAGATPVWVEVEEDTLGLGPREVAAAIGPRTEAVMPVHYAGHPARVAELAELCARHGLLLVEDAAEAAGARQNGAPVGSFGVGCFSFYGTKNMTTGGEGGMVTTGDAELAARIRTLRAHGMRPVPGAGYPWKKEAITPGYNFRMPEPLAAVGRKQLERLEGMNARRHAVAEQYDAALAATLGDWVRPHREVPGFHHVYHMYVARLRDASVRDEAVARLRAMGVEASVHFDPPVHRHEFYRDRYRIAGGDLRLTDELSSSVVTLPLYTVMSERSVDRVVSSLAQVLDALRAGR
ncbi:DegT/DnrJ/EryC1/StrS family aminotransferase [Streptomyces sp. NPDC020096]